MFASEPRVYLLSIKASNKNVGLAFVKWVYETLMPELRKTEYADVEATRPASGALESAETLVVVV